MTAKNPKQQSLFGCDAWSVLEKIRAKGILEETELAVLEQAINTSMPGAKIADWKQIARTWLIAHGQELGQRAPRPTTNEWAMLKKIAGRIGNTEQTCEVIRAFWAWRKKLTWEIPPQPSPFGLNKHLATVIDWNAKQKKAVSTVKRLEQDFERAKQNAPSKEEIDTHLSALPWKRGRE